MKSKQQKFEEAIVRQDRYNAMTDRQKLVKLNDGKFAAVDERERKGFTLLDENN